MRFESKRVLVTGAAGGIGSALVEAFNREGATVAAADRVVGKASATTWIEGDLLDAGYADTLPQNAAQ